MEICQRDKMAIQVARILDTTTGKDRQRNLQLFVHVNGITPGGWEYNDIMTQADTLHRQHRHEQQCTKCRRVFCVCGAM